MTDANRLTRIITKGGDTGQTSLGGGRRVPKSSLRIEAYGTVDELCSVLGLARGVHDLPAPVGSQLEQIQRDLFTLGGELCYAPEDLAKMKQDGVTEAMVERLETWAAEANAHLPPLREFILPAGAHGAAELHVARTVCRRAERDLVRLMEVETVRPPCLKYLNRLSDLFFILARACAEGSGAHPELWRRP
ncbi:MAG: cob(I)yrinic acid a,c-diamide adenosyltransferase [Planctomycetota bacterium]